VFIQGKSLVYSVILHILFFTILLIYFYFKPSPLPLLTTKRQVNLSVVQKAVKQETAAPSVLEEPIEKSKNPPATKPKEKEPPEAKTEAIREATKKPEPEPIETIEEELNEPLETKEAPQEESEVQESIEESFDSQEQVIPEESNLADDFTYSLDYSLPVTALDEPQEILQKDFLVDDLLISPSNEKVQTEGTDSLYSIELFNSASRRIMEVPSMVFDRKDPILHTLSDCRIGFIVTEEGLVRDIKMIPPGTGSETYDEILENILSRFLFTPGEKEEGVIAINFSKITGEES
jgi:hypothetical protein